MVKTRAVRNGKAAEQWDDDDDHGESGDGVLSDGPYIKSPLDTCSVNMNAKVPNIPDQESTSVELEVESGQRPLIGIGQLVKWIFECVAVKLCRTDDLMSTLHCASKQLALAIVTKDCRFFALQRFPMKWFVFLLE